MIITPQNRFDFNSDPGIILPPDYVVTFNGRVGSVSLLSTDVTNALGFRISVGTSAPGSPSIGDLWVDTN